MQFFIDIECNKFKLPYPTKTFFLKVSRNISEELLNTRFLKSKEYDDFIENDIEPLTDSKKRNIQSLLDVIHEKIQMLLITKPGNIDKKEVGYQCLVKLINKVENLSLFYLYDFVEHYKDIHVDLLEYLIFEIKTYSLVENAINKYPYMVRFTDKNGVLLIEKIMVKYLEESFDYTKDKELSLNSDLVYYDQILDLFFSSSKIKIPMKTKIEFIGKIEEVKRHHKPKLLSSKGSVEQCPEGEE